MKKDTCGFGTLWLLTASLIFLPISSAFSLPLSSLRLLVPPLRLMSAAMWQVACRRSVKHYEMLEDFVSVVTEAVPQLLTDRQRSLLLLALRAKVTLCDPDPQAVHAHLDRMRSVSMTMLDAAVSQWCSALLSLTDSLTQSPGDRRRLLQEVFNQSFDAALQSVISDFLSRLDQLFPIPDFRQAASWLDAVPACMDDCLHEADMEELRELLTNRSSQLGQATTNVGCDSEKILLSAWSHPLFTKLTNPHPPPTGTAAQSDPVLDWHGHTQRELDLIKEEVVIMTEEEQEEEEEEEEEEAAEEAASSGRSAVGEAGGAEDSRGQRSGACGSPPQKNSSMEPGGADMKVLLTLSEQERLKDSSEHCADQLEDDDTVDQSDEPSPNLLATISHNSQRVAHKCPQCGKCYIYRSQVIRHLRTSKFCGSAVRTTVAVSQNSQAPPPANEPRPPPPRPARAHSCFQCETIFKTKAELALHQRSHRTLPVYQCSQCDRKFHHLSGLTNHKQTHAVAGGFACHMCDKVFGSESEKDAHQLKHRLPDLTCTVCDKVFPSQSQLLRHLQTHSVEGAEPQYACRFCDESFSGVTQLRIHQRSHTLRAFQCDQCDKAYGSLAGLQSHRASHTNESRFLCSQCGKRFKTRDGLEGHLRTHTGERPYRCPYCPKDFTALAGLNVHVRRHTGERPYVCTVCGKSWPSGGDLQKHMRTHTGERPYTCQDCGKSFSISCHLTEHRRIHTGEKPFSCPECGKCLRRKFDLKKHMLSHSSVRPYACLYCPKSYTRKTHLNRHLLTHGTVETKEEDEEEELGNVT
ncbi:uncharacterized protein LOC143012612 isoform X3 [Genypterus blacodes]|uniref:uncharacterized protein LOC143012612 isoform X3 n=1 Tax=Genypterus blacodes TaxID=154954 RepID=UPI003F77053E